MQPLRFQTLLVYIFLLLVSIAGLWQILSFGSAQVAPNAITTARQHASAAPVSSDLNDGLADALLEALNHPLSLLLAQVIVIALCARFCGLLLQGFGQPRVVGEILAGILLGPHC